MPALIVLFMVIDLTIALFAWNFARKREAWLAVDYMIPIAIVFIWFFIAGMGVGAQSMSNLIEPILLLAMMPLLLVVKVFILDNFYSPKISSTILFITLFVFTVVMRLVMPGISE
ncbi:MAG: hypothetical protein WAO71_08450 [Gallionella sp.]